MPNCFPIGLFAFKPVSLLVLLALMLFDVVWNGLRWFYVV